MAKEDVPSGTLELLVLKTLSLGPLHGLGVSKRLEQLTGGTYQLNPGSFFPALHRLEQEGFLAGQWGRSENNRLAKFYRLTRAGRKRLKQQEREWRRTTSLIARVLEAG